MFFPKTRFKKHILAIYFTCSSWMWKETNCHFGRIFLKESQSNHWCVFRPVLNPGSGQTNYPPRFWLAFSFLLCSWQVRLLEHVQFLALNRNKTSLQPLLLSSSRLKTRSSGRASSPSGQEDSGITLLASFTKYLMDRNARCEIYVSIYTLPYKSLQRCWNGLGFFVARAVPSIHESDQLNESMSRITWRCEWKKKAMAFLPSCVAESMKCTNLANIFPVWNDPLMDFCSSKFHLKPPGVSVVAPNTIVFLGPFFHGFLLGFFVHPTIKRGPMSLHL